MAVKSSVCLSIDYNIMTLHLPRFWSPKLYEKLQASAARPQKLLRMYCACGISLPDEVLGRGLDPLKAANLKC